MCVYVRGRKLQKTRGAGLMDKGEMRKKKPYFIQLFREIWGFFQSVHGFVSLLLRFFKNLRGGI